MDTNKAVRIVSKNLVINVFGALWQFVLIIIGTRIVLHEMGADSFGLLALIGGTAGYFLYLDIGIGETVVKKVSETVSKEKLSRLVSTIFFFSIGFGLALSALVGIFAVYGTELLFSFSPPLMQSAAKMFLVIAAGLWILYPLNIFSKVFVGLQRLDVYNVLRIIFQTLILILIVASLGVWNSAEAAAAAITIGGIMWKATALVTLRIMYPDIEIRFSLFDRVILRDLLRYKSWATLSQASGHVIFQCDIYMIGMMLNPAMVAFYSIANIIAVKIAEIAGVLGTALFPMISTFHGKSMSEPIRKSFVLSTQLMTALLMPITFFIFVYSKPIITMWVGANYLDARPALAGLTIAWFINLIGSTGTFTAKAINEPELEARIVFKAAIANILLDYFFILKWGFLGAVYATVLVQAVAVIVLLYVMCRRLGVEPMPFFGRVLGMLIAGIVTGAVYLLPIPAHLFFIPLALHTAAFYLVCYLLVIDSENKMYLRNIIQMLRE